jgi:hypothetical protein
MAKELLLLTLQADVPAGGSLVVDTCGSSAAVDTELVLFDTLPEARSTCPDAGGMPACLTASDDAPGCGRRSRVEIRTAFPGATYPILVSTPQSPAGAPYTLRYSYALPSGTTAATPTPSFSVSGTVPQRLAAQGAVKNDVEFAGSLGGVGGALVLGLAVAAFFAYRWRKASKVMSSRNPTVILREKPVSGEGAASAAAYSSGASGNVDDVPDEFTGGSGDGNNPLTAATARSGRALPSPPSSRGIGGAPTSAARLASAASVRVLDLDRADRSGRASFAPSASFGRALPPPPPRV